MAYSCSHIITSLDSIHISWFTCTHAYDEAIIQHISHNRKLNHHLPWNQTWILLRHLSPPQIGWRAGICSAWSVHSRDWPNHICGWTGMADPILPQRPRPGGINSAMAASTEEEAWSFSSKISFNNTPSTQEVLRLPFHAKISFGSSTRLNSIL